MENEACVARQENHVQCISTTVVYVVFGTSATLREFDKESM